jgi:polyisoprenoid-binding protein YceI
MRRRARPIAPVLAALALVGGLSAAAPAKAEPARFEIDPEHVAVAFLIEHIGYAKTLGVFHEVSGGYTFDPETQTLSDLEITVATASVDTFHERRDDHVRSDDFLDVEAHPTMVFRMTEATPTSDTTGTVTGELTLLGETRPLTLDVTLNKIGDYPYGNPPNFVIGVSARGALDRSDFGMTYGVDNGLVGDRVELLIEAEAIRQ